MNNQYFWFGNNFLLGSRPVELRWTCTKEQWDLKLTLPYHNLAYFCPVCGEVWGRVTYDHAAPTWQITSRSCEKHGKTRLDAVAAGSFRITFPGEDPLQFAGDWPDNAIRYEGELLLRKIAQGLIDWKGLCDG